MSQRSVIALLALLCGTALAAVPARGGPASEATLAAARHQFQRAQTLEGKLESRLGGRREESDYLKVVAAYQRVEHTAPVPALVAPSLLEMGRLYRQMGQLFDSAYFGKSLAAYQTLIRRYPRSRLVPEALYDAARLEQRPLGNRDQARKFLARLVTKYPSSDQADTARLELASDSAGPKRAARSATSGAGDAGPGFDGEPLLSMADETGGEAGTSAVLVRSVAPQEAAGETDILVGLSGPVKYQSGRIARPDRVYFDLSRAYLAHPHGETIPVTSPYVGSLRVAQNAPHVVRLVLAIAPGTAYAASLLRAPYRLLIRLGPSPGRTGAAQPATTAAAYALPSKGNLSPARPLASGAPSLTRVLGLKIYRIVIDPGHGGFDTGTIGPNGLEEKTVCLAIALRLGRLIQQKLPDTQVIYTRKTDVFVPLQERTRIANQAKADLFISIHGNSSPDDAARGVEAYFLNFTTSPEALAVAARENALAQEPEHQLQSLLQKISLNDKIDESRALAADIDHTLVDQLQLGHVLIRDRGVKKAPFVVLIGAHMPSVLVEVSFLSNPTDERLLGEPRYRQRVAEGIFDGIRRYLASLNSLSFHAAGQASTDER